MRVVDKTGGILSSYSDDTLLVILTEMATRLLATVDLLVSEILPDDPNLPRRRLQD